MKSCKYSLSKKLLWVPRPKCGVYNTEYERPSPPIPGFAGRWTSPEAIVRVCTVHLVAQGCMIDLHMLVDQGLKLLYYGVWSMEYSLK